MLVLRAYLLSVVHLEDKGGVPYHPTAFGLHAVTVHFSRVKNIIDSYYTDGSSLV